MHISVLFKFNFLVSYQTFPLYSHYLSHFYFDRPGLIFDFVYSIFKKNILKLSRLTDSCTALLHRLRNKKLSCRWQTARRICEICNGVADLLKTPLLLNFILCLLLKSILTDAKYFSKILFLKYISKIAVTYWRLFSVLCWHCIKCAFILLLLFILFFFYNVSIKNLNIKYFWLVVIDTEFSGYRGLLAATSVCCRPLTMTAATFCMQVT